MRPLSEVARSASGDSTLIKGRLQKEAGEGMYPAFSASGQDVFNDTFTHEGKAVILSAVGARCGKCFLASGKWSAIANTHIIWPDESLVDHRYLYYLLNDESFWVRGGSAQPFVKVKASLAQEVPVPPLEEQRRIVARIQECLSRVEEMERLQAEVAEDEKVITLKFLEEEYDRLCAENKTLPLSECADVTGGGTPNRKTKSFWDGDIPWVSPKDMKRWEIDSSQESITKAAVNGSSVRMIHSDAVLFVVRGMILLHTVPVAISRVPLTINQDMKALLPKEGYSSEFLAFMLKAASPKLLRKVNIAGHGTRRLETKDWIDLPIPQVGKFQAQIVERLERFRSASQELLAAQAQLDTAALRNTILRQAFAGEL